MVFSPSVIFSFCLKPFNSHSKVYIVCGKWNVPERISPQPYAFLSLDILCVSLLTV